MRKIYRSERYQALRDNTVLCGHYIIKDMLGQGSFGITYKAFDNRNNCEVAIKEYFPLKMSERNQTGIRVKPSAGKYSGIYNNGLRHFYKEAEMLHSLRNIPGVVTVKSYFLENGTGYFTMEYLEGQDMKKLLDRRGRDGEGPLDWLNALEMYFLPVMDVLSTVHSKGIYHRDIKPANIFITKDNEVKVIDFGTACYITGDESKSLIGTPTLVQGFAPEELYSKGEQGSVTDVYSLAATYYYAITGTVPVHSHERDRLRIDVLAHPRELGVPMSTEAEKVLLKAMSVSPNDRYQSMDEFKNALLNSHVNDNGEACVRDRVRILPHDTITMSEKRLVFEPAGSNEFVENRKAYYFLQWMKRLVFWTVGAAVLSAAGMAAYLLHKKINANTEIRF